MKLILKGEVKMLVLMIFLVLLGLGMIVSIGIGIGALVGIIRLTNKSVGVLTRKANKQTVQVIIRKEDIEEA